MKYFFYIVLMSCFPAAMAAQGIYSVDLGLGVGATSYYGDINPEKPFYNPNLGIDVFFRYNFNSRYALRANVLTTKLEADDLDFQNPNQQNRKAYFSSKILELSAIGEVNFFPFSNPKDWSTERSSIYALVGAGMAMKFGIKQDNVNVPVIIMGGGYKKLLGGRWALELEWSFRKCLNDKIDNLTNPLEKEKDSNFFNNDWYNILEAKLVYNFWQSGKCRTFERDKMW